MFDSIWKNSLQAAGCLLEADTIEAVRSKKSSRAVGLVPEMEPASLWASRTRPAWRKLVETISEAKP